MRRKVWVIEPASYPYTPGVEPQDTWKTLHIHIEVIPMFSKLLGHMRRRNECTNSDITAHKEINVFSIHNHYFAHGVSCYNMQEIKTKLKVCVAL